MTAQPRDSGRRARNLARAVVDEDLSADPQDVIRNYEAMIADFDSRREHAAQAVVRLGEAYRRLGRLEEARVQFARVLREFVDFPDLVRLSQQQLVQHTSPEARGGNAFNPPPAPSAEERALLEEELALLGQQLARAQELVKTGTAPDSSLFPIQRDILQLRQRLARLSASLPATRPAREVPSNPTGGGNPQPPGSPTVVRPGAAPAPPTPPAPAKPSE